MVRVRLLTAWAMLLMLLTGCATAPYGEADPDPLEDFNRYSYNVTDAFDHLVLGPVADAYLRTVPDAVRVRVSNFYDNAGYLNTVMNDFLQGKFEQGVSDAARFAVNSTVGVLGLFDVATSMGLPAHDEDFGQTLGVWGAGEGAYLFVPIRGPSSLRDVADTPLSIATNVLTYVDTTINTPLAILGVINTRAEIDAAIKVRDQTALDPYVFTREAYRQNRMFRIHDGNPPLPGLDDLDAVLDEELDRALQ